MSLINPRSKLFSPSQAKHILNVAEMTKSAKNEQSTIKEIARAYRKTINALYHGHINLSPEAIYNRSFAILHDCSFCGNEFLAKATTVYDGGGCTRCRTRKANVDAFVEHMRIVQEIHGDTFKPTLNRIPNYTGKRREMYSCKCGHQRLLKPKVLEDRDRKYRCPVCEKQTQRARISKNYAQRLEMMYGSTTRCVERYHQTRALLHSCSRTAKIHQWRAPASDLLQGQGCPKCKTMDDIARILPFKYRGATYHLTKKLHKKALQILLYELKFQGGKLKGEERKQAEIDRITTARLKTQLTYPIPALIGSRVPAFYMKSTNMLIDVFTGIKFKEFRAKGFVARSFNRAKELGYGYGVVIISNGVAVFLPTEGWLLETRIDDLPDDWSSPDVILTSKCTRFPVLASLS